MKAIVLLVAGSTLFLQVPGAPTSPPPSPSPSLSPRALLDARRALTSAEIGSVLRASREAVAGKTFRLSSGFAAGPEVLMRGDGQPARIRMSYGIVGGVVSGSGQSSRWTEDITKIVDYTGRPARRCGGAAAAAGDLGELGELVVEYIFRRITPERQPPEWTVTARRSVEREPGMPGLMPVFEMLRGASGASGVGGLGSLASDDNRERFGDRSARGFVAAFIQPHDDRRRSHSSPPLIGDPEPNVAGERPPQKESKPVQTLWIDTQSLLPLQWEVTDNGRRLVRYDFIFEPIDIPLPADAARTAPPDCIR